MGTAALLRLGGAATIVRLPQKNVPMMIRIAVLLGSALALSGCASGSWMPSMDMSWMSLGTSAPSGSPLRLDSDPAGAEARTSIGPSCRTPCTVNLPTGNDFTVTFTLPGFVPQSVPVQAGRINARFDPDASLPSAFDPDPVEVALEPAPPEPVGRRKPMQQRPPPRQPS